jgi:hypothetical protein
MSEYESDILIWSEHQAALLRRVAAGEPVNEAPDWPNIVEEIESLGRSQVDAVESLLFQAVVHMLKAEAWPFRWRRRAGGCQPPLPVPAACPVTLDELLDA